MLAGVLIVAPMPRAVGGVLAFRPKGGGIFGELGRTLVIFAAGPFGRVYGLR